MHIAGGLFQSGWRDFWEWGGGGIHVCTSFLSNICEKFATNIQPIYSVGKFLRPKLFAIMDTDFLTRILE